MGGRVQKQTPTEIEKKRRSSSIILLELFVREICSDHNEGQLDLSSYMQRKWQTFEYWRPEFRKKVGLELARSGTRITVASATGATMGVLGGGPVGAPTGAIKGAVAAIVTEAVTAIIQNGKKKFLRQRRLGALRSTGLKDESKKRSLFERKREEKPADEAARVRAQLRQTGPQSRNTLAAKFRCLYGSKDLVISTRYMNAAILPVNVSIPSSQSLFLNNIVDSERLIRAEDAYHMLPMGKELSDLRNAREHIIQQAITGQFHEWEWEGFFSEFILNHLDGPYELQIRNLYALSRHVFFKPPKSGRLNELFIDFPQLMRVGRHREPEVVRVQNVTGTPNQTEEQTPLIQERKDILQLWEGTVCWPFLDFLYFIYGLFHVVRSFDQEGCRPIVVRGWTRGEIEGSQHFFNTPQGGLDEFLQINRRILYAIRYYFLAKNFYVHRFFKHCVPQFEREVKHGLDDAVFVGRNEAEIRSILVDYFNSIRLGSFMPLRPTPLNLELAMLSGDHQGARESRLERAAIDFHIYEPIEHMLESKADALIKARNMNDVGEIYYIKRLLVGVCDPLDGFTREDVHSIKIKHVKDYLNKKIKFDEMIFSVVKDFFDSRGNVSIYLVGSLVDALSEIATTNIISRYLPKFDVSSPSSITSIASTTIEEAIDKLIDKTAFDPLEDISERLIQAAANKINFSGIVRALYKSYSKYKPVIGGMRTAAGLVHMGALPFTEGGGLLDLTHLSGELTSLPTVGRFIAEAAAHQVMAMPVVNIVCGQLISAAFKKAHRSIDENIIEEVCEIVSIDDGSGELIFTLPAELCATIPGTSIGVRMRSIGAKKDKIVKQFNINQISDDVFLQMIRAIPLKTQDLIFQGFGRIVRHEMMDTTEILQKFHSTKEYLEKFDLAKELKKPPKRSFTLFRLSGEKTSVTVKYDQAIDKYMNEYLDYINYLAQLHLCFYHAELYSKIVDCIFRYFKVLLEEPVSILEEKYRDSVNGFDFTTGMTNPTSDPDFWQNQDAILKTFLGKMVEEFDNMNRAVVSEVPPAEAMRPHEDVEIARPHNAPQMAEDLIETASQTKLPSSPVTDRVPQQFPPIPATAPAAPAATTITQMWKRFFSSPPRPIPGAVGDFLCPANADGKHRWHTMASQRKGYMKCGSCGKESPMSPITKTP